MGISKRKLEITTGLNILCLVECTALLGCAQNIKPIWQADFEQGSLSDWSYLLNQQGINISNGHSHCGQFAAKITVLGDDSYLWNGNANLNRVEMQYSPKSVKSGKTTWLSWYFMLPEALSEEKHEFAYWESNRSYQQIMRFELSSDRIQFGVTGDKEAVWQYNGLETGVWYKLAMRVFWSDSPDMGNVSVWFNDQQVVESFAAKTLISTNESAFIQLGLLRRQSKQPETIWIDHVSEVHNVRQLKSLCI